MASTKSGVCRNSRCRICASIASLAVAWVALFFARFLHLEAVMFVRFPLNASHLCAEFPRVA
eukprot:922548-Lingulodinium_polyedra.AAC.1